MSIQEPISESILASPAKINIYLKVLGLRQDGYHELDTLFYPIHGLYDTIRIEPGHDEHMFMRCPENPDLESTSNLIYKAWKAFGEATGYQPGMFVTLNKNIPMGGGLGGGSSNGATILRWLNENAGTKALPHDELIQLAVGLGADVPFFLMDGPARAQGVGEKLEASDISLSGFTLLLAMPDLHVDTPWAFKAWDEKQESISNKESLTTPANLTKNSSPDSTLVVENDLESIVFSQHPELRSIKERLMQSGAMAASMSGSGATIFGLFRDRANAESAAAHLEKNGIEIFMTACS
ncbi:MAG: 4-(cytidine 5'-diphospho)-2-C-methyl-D-erythritol kinase [Desulfovibrio sp.]|nr:4-(cytidine 5'-diphospho)-2-C-methyl-D-erythritol kinase [Desulfovibrio sp.]|tara:strand:- start:1203 stop:2087 length:885 start_codon:yes stop_codon:yes gene_type:complete